MKNKVECGTFKLKLSFKQHTVDNEARFAGVGGAKVVGDDALVAALVSEGDVPQVQDGGVLHHASACTRRLRCRALVVSPHVGEVLRLGVAEQLLVLPPGKRHRGRAAARCRASEVHVAAEDGHGGFRLHGNLRLRKVVWGGAEEVRTVIVRRLTRRSSLRRKHYCTTDHTRSCWEGPGRCWCPSGSLDGHRWR